MVSRDGARDGARSNRPVLPSGRVAELTDCQFPVACGGTRIGGMLR